jgi:hypothetical protein
MLAFLQMLLLICKIAEVYFFGLLFLSILVSIWNLTDEARATWKETNRKRRAAKQKARRQARIREHKEETAQKAMMEARRKAFLGDPYMCGFDSEGKLIVGEWMHFPTFADAQTILDEAEQIVKAEQKQIQADELVFINTEEL